MKQKYIVISTGIDKSNVADRVLSDAKAYLEDYKEKVVVFTDLFSTIFDQTEGYKAVPYNYVKNIKKNEIILVNNRGTEINQVIKEVLPELSNCLVIVAELNLSQENISELIKAHKERSVGIIWNCKDVIELKGSELCKEFSGFAIHKGLEKSVGTCINAQEQFGGILGTGLYLASQLKEAHLKRYERFCEENNKKPEKHIVNNPIYYYQGRIIINKKVWDEEIDAILEESAFIDKTKNELEELYFVK